MKSAAYALKSSLGAIALTLAASPVLADDHATETVVGEAEELVFPLTPEGAEQFVAAAEKEMLEFSNLSSHVYWLQATNINYDSNKLVAEYGARATVMSVKYAKEAAQYADIEGLSQEVRRKLDKLRNGISMPAP